MFCPLLETLLSDNDRQVNCLEDEKFDLSKDVTIKIKNNKINSINSAVFMMLPIYCTNATRNKNKKNGIKGFHDIKNILLYFFK